LQSLRKGKGLTLDSLSRLSGISRSMLSQVERGEANPTLATVWSLASALHVDVSELIGVRPGDERSSVELIAANFTPEIRSEDGLCVLRILSPADRVGTLEWYELTIDVNGALRSEPHARGTREHLTVFEGVLAVEVGGAVTTVPAGSTVRYAADVAHAIVQAGSQKARALLVVTL
jgi:transcriptional regulator with XRE-family HTH domain